MSAVFDMAAEKIAASNVIAIALNARSFDERNVAREGSADIDEALFDGKLAFSF